MKQTARALMMAVLLCGVVAAIPTPPASAQDCPELLGSWPYGPAWGVAVAGTRAYVGSGRALMVVDVSNPAAPALVGSDDTFGFATRVSLSGGLAVLADDRDGISVYDDCQGVVFDDGFESGDTSAWSAVQP